MKAAALKYARANWSIFPVLRTEEGHSPLVRNWPNQATSQAEVIEGWWDTWPEASIGAIPSSVGLLAIDYDTKTGRSVEELRGALADVLGEELPDTGMVALTPSGGEHHYYRVSEPLTSSNGRVVKGVDIRSAANGYIMLPPSMDGRYTWAGLGKAASFPSRAYAVLGRPSAVADKEWLIDPDLPENINLAEQWIASDKCSPSVEGQGGNQALYDTACMMVSFGLSPETAAEVIARTYNVTKCSPGWDLEDIERVVVNAYRYHTSAPGNLTPAYHRARLGFGPIGVSESDTKGTKGTKGTAHFRISDREDMRGVRPPEWLIEPYLQAETCAILTGGYSTYKSFIALDMALSVATGVGRTAWDAQVQGPAVYMLGEGRAGMRSRLATWEKYHGITVERNDILFVDPVPHVTQGSEIRDQLLEALLKLGDGFKFVVMDTMGRAMSGLNENASETASALSKLASDVRDGLGATVLAVGHTRKDRATGQGATRGSGVFENDADTVLNVEKTGELEVLLEVVKQKDAPEADALSLSLKEVMAGTDVSLVVVPTGEKPKQKARVEVHALLDRVAVALLESDPHKYWSTNNLASNVALDDRITLGQEAVRKRLLDMSVRDAYAVSGMFVPARGQGNAKWKYSPPRRD